MQHIPGCKITSYATSCITQRALKRFFLRYEYGELIGRNLLYMISIFLYLYLYKILQDPPFLLLLFHCSCEANRCACTLQPGIVRLHFFSYKHLSCCPNGSSNNQPCRVPSIDAFIQAIAISRSNFTE